MTASEMTDPDIDKLLRDARGAGPVPSDALMARIMADAVAVQPRPGQPPVPRWASGVGQWLDRLAAVFGGGAGLAGVCSAMVAGIFIGITQPAPVVALTSVLLADTQTDSVDLFPAEVVFWEEPQND